MGSSESGCCVATSRMQIICSHARQTLWQKSYGLRHSGARACHKFLIPVIAFIYASVYWVSPGSPDFTLASPTLGQRMYSLLSRKNGGEEANTAEHAWILRCYKLLVNEPDGIFPTCSEIVLSHAIQAKAVYPSHWLRLLALKCESLAAFFTVSSSQNMKLLQQRWTLLRCPCYAKFSPARFQTSICKLLWNCYPIFFLIWLHRQSTVSVLKDCFQTNGSYTWLLRLAWPSPRSIATLSHMPWQPVSGRARSG